MESIGKFFGKMGAEQRTISPEELVLAAWRGAVGKNIAKRTRAAKLVRKRLVIEVEDELWRRNLSAMDWQILRSLEVKLGVGVVDELTFKVVPRKIEPQRAASSLFPQDEADTILDPVMRHIYKQARRKETA